MDNRMLGVLLLGAAIYAATQTGTSPPSKPPAVPVKPAPKPTPPPPPPPPPKPKPWGKLSHAPVGASVGGARHSDGTEINCDLPGELHQKNTGGSDGAGLCVYASNRHTGRWQNCQQFEYLFEWMKKHPGGSYPEKFTQTLEQCCKEKGWPVPDYLQIESTDLEILKKISATGRMLGVTYGISPTGRYNGQTIAHMVSLVHADDRHFVVLDNNYPGEDQYEWMTPQEFLKAYASHGNGWAVVLLNPGPPPPPPRN